MTEKLLTVEEVAEIFSVTPYTIRKWVKDGKLASSKPNGWHIRIPYSSVVVLAQQKHGE